MGEAKKRREREQVDPWAAALNRLSRELADEGKLIKAGFVSMRAVAIPRDAPDDQIEEMETAFMAGAQHLFGSIMGILDPGEEPTDDDMRRMDLIDRELKEWIDRYKLKHFRAEGNA